MTEPKCQTGYQAARSKRKSFPYRISCEERGYHMVAFLQETNSSAVTQSIRQILIGFQVSIHYLLTPLGALENLIVGGSKSYERRRES